MNKISLDQQVLGEEIELLSIDPSQLKQIDVNAHFMKQDKFKQLVENIRVDGRLESVPLCHRKQNGEIEIISGNHRVLAAVQAGIKEILVMVFKNELKIPVKRAKQISHNVLIGEDDPNQLRLLWDQMDDMKEKIYSGLDSMKLNELENINFKSLSSAPVTMEAITFWFLPEEIKNLDEIAEIAERYTLAKDVYVVPLKAYHDLFEMLVKVKLKKNIKNNAVAMCLILSEIKEIILEKLTK